MNFGKRTIKSALCIFLAVLLLIMSLSALTVFAEVQEIGGSAVNIGEIDEDIAPVGSGYTYCRNNIGWSSVYVYAWNTDSDKLAEWPGKQMTNIGDNVWQYELTKEFSSIIFNNGNGGNGNQTADLQFPGVGQIYDLSKNSWSGYDTSSLTIDSFTTDKASPQKPGTSIVIKASASGEGTVSYKFSVKSSSGTTVLKDYSTTSQVTWTPTATGSYTLLLDVKDSKGNTNSKQLSYTISDGSTPPPSSTVVYCKNSANWSTVTVYAWNSENDKNANWPGEKMTNIGDDIWQYNYKKDFKNIIFSENGNNQTSDLVFPGSGQIFDNATGAWDVYDTSTLKILGFSADPESPQYPGVDITLKANATGEGTVSYKFSAKSSSGTQVISDYSDSNEVVWTPSAVGTYTLTLDVKDSKNNTNSRTITYKIEDDSQIAAPIIKSVTPGSGYILKGSACNISVSAGGGHTGTNILFYKYTVADSNGKTVNVPYYTKNKTYKFTPTALGTYTLTVSVQASDVENTTVVKEIQLESVNSIPSSGLKVGTFTTSGTLKIGNTIEIKAAASGGKTPYTYEFLFDGNVIKSSSSVSTCSYKLTEEGSHTLTVNVKDGAGDKATKSMTINVGNGSSPGGETRTLKGDSDRNGTVEVVDATMVQQYLAQLIGDSKLNLANADADDDDTITVVDATYIQQYLAKLRKW